MQTSSSVRRRCRFCIVFEFIQLLNHAIMISMLNKVILGAEIPMAFLMIVNKRNKTINYGNTAHLDLR